MFYDICCKILIKYGSLSLTRNCQGLFYEIEIPIELLNQVESQWKVLL